MNRTNQNLAHQIKGEGLWAPLSTQLKTKNPILELGKHRSRKDLNNRTKSAQRPPRRGDKARRRGQAREFRTRATPGQERGKSIKQPKGSFHHCETTSKKRDELLLLRTLLTIKVRPTTFSKQGMLPAGRRGLEASGLTRMPGFRTLVQRTSVK